MRKLTHLVISLPLLVAPLIVTGVSPLKAAAQNIGPTGAVKLLAQSRTADARCHHLNAKEHSELNDYVAKAEIAAATMSTAARAQSARRTGNKLGQTMACGQNSKDLVLATLDAARRAMASARSQTRKRRTVSHQPAVRQSPRQPAQRATDGTFVTISAKDTNLTRYRRVTEAYYLERRCQHLSRSQAMTFWKKIVSQHNAVLKKYKTSQVSKAKSGAETAARKWGRCGTRTARIVKAGYRG